MGRLRQGLVSACVFAGAVLSCSASVRIVTAAPPSDIAGMTTTPVLESIPGTPVAAEFSPDGRIFIALKDGVVLAYDGAADTTPVTTLDIGDVVMSFHDRGLLGIALDPGFTSSRPYLYVLYTYDRDPFGTNTAVPRWGDDCPTPPGGTTDGCTVSARLDRYTLNASSVAAGAPVRLLDGADGALGGWCQQFDSHSIGSLAFGADGMLYVGAGDGASYNYADYGQSGGSLPGTPTPANPCNDKQGTTPHSGGRGTRQSPLTARGGALRAQAVRDAEPHEYVSWNGAILRIDPNTGAAAAGNPLLGNGIDGDDRIVAYGLRNPFRFDVRPGTNQLWLGDVGWSTWEEVDHFEVDPAQGSVPNFGWPCYEGASRQSSYDGLNLGLCEALYANPNQAIGGVPSPLVLPDYAWRRIGNPGALPCGAAAAGGGGSATGGQFAANQAWPMEIRGAYVFGDYARQCIAVMPLGSNGMPDPTKVRSIVSGAFPVDIELGPGGDIYWLDIATSSLNRIRPTNTNVPPIASFTATPQQGPAPLDVTFDGGASSDANVGQALSHAWDLDGDGQCDDATGVRIVHRYATPMVVTVKLCVTDALGATDTATRQIQVGNNAPVIRSFGTSADASRFAVGDVVTFAADAVDDGGVLPATAYTWRLELRHCESETGSVCHTHPLSTPLPGRSGSFVAPDHEYYAKLRLTLTVTDAAGVTATQVREIAPRIATVTLVSQPPGLPVSIGEAAGAAPQTRPFLEGGSVQLVAPPSAVVGDGTWSFVGWSDDPLAPTPRTLPAPAGASTYTAQYAPSSGHDPVDITATTVGPATLDSRVNTRIDVGAVVVADRGVASVVAGAVGPQGSSASAPLTDVGGGGWSGAVDLAPNAPPGEYVITVLATDIDGRVAFAEAGRVLVVWSDVGTPVLPAAGITTVEPVRLLDTRIGTGAPAARLEPGGVLRLQVTGAAPGIDATTRGVVVNVAAVDAAGGGYVTVYPCGTPPLASNLNLVAGETSANLATVPLDSTGAICFTGSQATDLIADVTGLFRADGALMTGIQPVRVVDTRAGIGIPAGVVAAGTPVRVPLDAAGVPAGAAGVVATVTVTEPGSAGHLTAYPCANGGPLASNLNFTTGQTVSNLVVTALDPDGGLCVTSNADVHLVVDVSGWLAEAGGRVAIVAPFRAIDTRQGRSLDVGETLRLPADALGAPADATAAIVNVTAVDPIAAGFLTVAPCEATQGATSNVNFRAGETRPVLAIARFGPSREVCVHASQPMDVVLDVQGFVRG